MMGLCALVVLSGCLSIQEGKTPDGDDHVLIENSGWYLFNKYPLVCGNSSKDPRFPTVMFRDDVTMEKAQDRMLALAQQKGKRMTDLVYSNNDDVMLSIPLLIVNIPIPYLITYHEIQLSGVLK